MVVSLGTLYSPEGFYATNNQFQQSGPKGFIEYKRFMNEDIFIRLDLPGLPKEAVRVLLHESKRAVHISGEAPKEHKHDSSERTYGTFVGIFCECCEIASDFTYTMADDGVLRINLSKTNIVPPSCLSTVGSTNPNDPEFLGTLLKPNPFVQKGPNFAYESKQLQNGSLFVRVDMPGVPKDKFTVSVNNGMVNVTGEAPALSHDSGGRFYAGDVARLTSVLTLPIRKIKTIANNGVIRLIIPPV